MDNRACSSMRWKGLAGMGLLLSSCAVLIWTVASVRGLRERIETLEGTIDLIRSGASETPPAPAAGDVVASTALADRIRVLEDRISFDTNDDAGKMLIKIDQLGRGRHSRAGLKLMQEFLELHRGHSGEQWVAHECVAAYLKMGDRSAARAIIRSYRGAHPNDYLWKRDAGALMLLERKYKDALMFFEGVAADTGLSGPERLEARLYVGYTSMQEGDLTAAISVLDDVAQSGLYTGDLRMMAIGRGARSLAEQCRAWIATGRER